MTLSRLGMVDPDPGGVAESLASLDEAIALIEPALRANPKSSTMAIQLSMTREYAGHRLLALGQIAAAERQYRQGLAEVEAPIATARLSNVVQAFTHEEALAALFTSKGDRASALDFANRAVIRATALYNIDPKSEPRIAHLGRAYAELAAVDRAFKEAAASRAASQRALEIWSTIKDRPAMFLHRQSYESTLAFLSAQFSQ